MKQNPPGSSSTQQEVYRWRDVVPVSVAAISSEEVVPFLSILCWVATMKIRQGSSKAKPKIQKDFKKKSAKVGKKVARSNVTEIKIQSKRINIPLQSAITAKAPADEQEALDKLLKQLHHYSAPSRVAALEELKALLGASRHGESYISLIFPKALELLFDDDYSARRALMALLGLLLTRFNSVAFASVISIAITYICSGLTSLNRGVVRDSLSLLQLLADTHSTLLTPYLEKLLVHVLSLLTASGHTQSKISSSGVLAIGKAVVANTGSASAGSSSSSGSGGGGGGVGSSSGKDGAGGVASDGSSGSSRSDRDTYASICVVSTLLSCAAQSSDRSGAERDREEDMQTFHYNETPNVALLRPRYRKCRWLESVGQQQTFHTLSVKGQTRSHVTEDSEWLSDSLLADLCSRLRSIWSGLVLDESKLAADVVPTLREVAKIAYTLGQAGEGSRLAEYRLLVGALFAAFPHRSVEAGVAVTGSAAETVLNKNVYALDVTLCGVSLLFLSDTKTLVSQYDASVQAAVSKAKAYILVCLSRHIDEIENASTVDVTDAGDAMDAEVDDETEEEEEDVEEEEEEVEDEEDEEEEVDREEDQEVEGDEEMANSSPERRKKSNKNVTRIAVKPNNVDSVEIATRMYSSLQVMALAGDSSDPVIVEVLEMMRRLVQVTVDSTNFAMKRQTLLKIIRPGILCLCSIAINPALWTRGYGPAALAPLVSSLVSSVSLMVRWPKEPGGEMTSALLQAMLTILRKMQLDGAESGLSRQGAQLCECIHSLFSSAISYSNDSAGALKSSKSAPSTFYALCLPAQRITLLNLYLHGPFADVLAVTKVVASSLATANRKLSAVDQEQQQREVQYFLRLMHERRSEFSLPDFFDILFFMLRLSISSWCKGFSASSDISKKIARALSLPERWTAHEIADVLLWCSSADAPFKIVSFLAPAIENAASVVTSSLREKTPEQLSERWLAEHLAVNAVTTIIMSLLRPCFAFRAGEAEAETVQMAEPRGDSEDRALISRYCELLGKKFVHQSAAFGQAISLAGAELATSIHSQDVQWQLYKTAALCLSTSTPFATSRFLVFECYLDQLLLSWSDSQTTPNCRTWLLKGLAFFLTFNCLASPRVVCREKLMATLTSLSRVSAANEGQCEAALQTILKDVV